MEFGAHGKKELLSKAVTHFPDYFRGSYKANHQKVSTWWRDRNIYLDEAAGAPASLQRCQISKVTIVNLKALAGRGCKQSDWVVHNVHAVPMDKFLRLGKTGLKFSKAALLGSLARDIIRKEEGVFNSHYRDPRDQKMIIRKILPRWVQCFMDKKYCGPLSDTSTGKLMCSPEKELHVQNTIAFHLGQLHRGFALGELDENFIDNMDETHFVVNVDN